MRARTISDEMCLAAAQELARCAEAQGIHEEYIVPTMDEWGIYPREAVAMGMKAQEQGLARLHVDAGKLHVMAVQAIQSAREQVQLLMREGLIVPMSYARQPESF